MLSELSRLDEDAIHSLLAKSRTQKTLILPSNLRLFETVELTNTIMLYYLVRSHKPRLVVETGVWSGKTSWGILQALHDNKAGKLISIDLGAKQAGSSKLPTSEIGGLVPADLRPNWHIVIGDAKNELPKLFGEFDGCDMFYHDSNHTYEHMTFEFKTALIHLRADGVLASDDVLLNNAFEEITFMLDNPVIIDGRLAYGFKKV